MPTTPHQPTDSERHEHLDELIQVEREIARIKQLCAELSKSSSQSEAHLERLVDLVRRRNHLMGAICRMDVPIRIEIFLS